CSSCGRRGRHVCVRLAGAATEDRTMKAALQNYHARMQRVLDHIDRHLDDDLDLDALSSVAAYSKYHFHRQFTATFGMSVHRYVQLARMKRASYRRHHPAVHRVAQGRWPAPKTSPTFNVCRSERRPASPADYSMCMRGIQGGVGLPRAAGPTDGARRW